MPKNEKSISSKKLSRVGAAAARARQALDDLREAEEKRQLAYREKLEEAKRAAAALTKRLQHIENEKLRAQEGRFAGLLGRMVLTAMKRQGLAGSLLQADDLATWKIQDLHDLKAFLAVNAKDPFEVTERETAAFDVAQLDLDLSE